MKTLVIAYIVSVFTLVYGIVVNIVNGNHPAVAGYTLALMWCITAAILTFKNQ